MYSDIPGALPDFFLPLWFFLLCSSIVEVERVDSHSFPIQVRRDINMKLGHCESVDWLPQLRGKEITIDEKDLVVIQRLGQGSQVGGRLYYLLFWGVDIELILVGVCRTSEASWNWNSFRQKGLCLICPYSIYFQSVHSILIWPLGCSYWAEQRCFWSGPNWTCLSCELQLSLYRCSLFRFCWVRGKPRGKRELSYMLWMTND